MTLLERVIPAATAAALTEVCSEVHAWALEVGLDEATVEDMTLAVYEAMTNAVEHAYPPERAGPVALTASCAGEMLEVVVCDQGVWHDPPPTRAVAGGACN